MWWWLLLVLLWWVLLLHYCCMLRLAVAVVGGGGMTTTTTTNTTTTNHNKHHHHHHHRRRQQRITTTDLHDATLSGFSHINIMTTPHRVASTIARNPIVVVVVVTCGVAQAIGACTRSWANVPSSPTPFNVTRQLICSHASKKKT